MTTSVRQRSDLPLAPLEVFLRVPDHLHHLSFLTSDGTQGSRWSILAWNPVEQLSFDGKETWRNGQPVQGRFRDHLHALFEQRAQHDSSLPFVGGAIGAIQYEYAYQLLDLPFEHDGSPLVEYQFYDDALVFDHEKQLWFQLGEELELLPATPHLDSISFQLTPHWSLETFRERFDIVHDHIRRGEVYQACLTFPFFADALKNPRHAFAQFLRSNPAPMAAYLELPSRTVLSLSPERFFSWDGETIETKPIKGTRPRGSNLSEDEQFKIDLLTNEKEKAELNMITDLLRNDLSKVCIPGSVQVLEHQSLQELPKLWHTYSHIVGKTNPDTKAWDLIEALFPGGSISGCPKRRAVELLSKVEQHNRGVYTGSIGYISDNGGMDQSIAIRTIEQTDLNRAQCSFGSGIVYDSLALSEYQECLAKSLTFSHGKADSARFETGDVSV